MSQPTFTDGPPVPLLVEGLIDAVTLQQLFTDLKTHATVVAVREKNAPTAYTTPDGQTLAAAFERLRDGTARALQVQYHFDGHDWVDTIMALPSGFRVVRCRANS